MLEGGNGAASTADMSRMRSRPARAGTDTPSWTPGWRFLGVRRRTPRTPAP